MMDLYAEYRMEGEGVSVISTPEYFFAYKIVDKEMYVSDYFITKNKRHTQAAQEIWDQVFGYAKLSNCTRVTGRVWLRNPLIEYILGAYFKRGFRINHATAEYVAVEHTVNYG